MLRKFKDFRVIKVSFIRLASLNKLIELEEVYA